MMRAAFASLFVLIPLAGVSRAETAPASARFLAAAEAAPERARLRKPELEELKSMREQVLKTPETAEKSEEILYRILLPGLAGMQPPRREEVLAFERRRSSLLARLAETAGTRTVTSKAFSARLAALKIGALTAWLPSELARLESELDELTSARVRVESFLSARWGAPDLRARLLSPYTAFQGARTREAFSAAFDGSKCSPAAAALTRAQTSGLPRLHFSLTLAAPVRTTDSGKRSPPPPTGLSGKQWARPVMRRMVKLLDYYGEKLGVYDLLQRAGASDPRVFLLALIKRESDFDPQGPPSSKGAIGLMQVMPQTAADLRVRGDLTDMRVNIRAGLLYLRYALKTLGRLDLALAGYNAGVGRVLRHGGIPPIKETQAYVRLILRDYAAMMMPLPLKSASL